MPYAAAGCQGSLQRAGEDCFEEALTMELCSEASTKAKKKTRKHLGLEKKYCISRNESTRYHMRKSRGWYKGARKKEKVESKVEKKYWVSKV